MRMSDYHSLEQQKGNKSKPFIDQKNAAASIDKDMLARKITAVQKILASLSEQRSKLLEDWPDQKFMMLAGQCADWSQTTEGLYIGQQSNGLMDGYGLLLMHQSPMHFYEGQFAQNQRHGHGTEFCNGEIYKGLWKNGKPQDEGGLFVWGNGAVFYGCFVAGVKHGYGTCELPGLGYTGDWRWNQPDGQGLIWTTQSEYRGGIKGGFKHGHGCQFFANGDKYTGNYSTGKPQGRGTYIWSNGAVYKGEFEKGLRSGRGVWSLDGEIYEGEYQKDKRNGQGVYQWTPDNYYRGGFKEDLRHGFGEMHWAKDCYYKGQWHQGMQHGSGQIWEHGSLVEQGTYKEGFFQGNPSEILAKVPASSLATKINMVQQQDRLQKGNQKSGRYHGQQRRSYSNVDQLWPKPVPQIRLRIVEEKLANPEETQKKTRLIEKQGIRQRPNLLIPLNSSQRSQPKQNSLTRPAKVIGKSSHRPRFNELTLLETQLTPRKWNNFRNLAEV